MYLDEAFDYRVCSNGFRVGRMDSNGSDQGGIDDLV